MLTDAEFQELLRERDPFKLAIRGQSAIEADIDAAIAEAFTGEVPGELRSVRYGIKLALGVALGIIPSQLKATFDAFAQLRNDFAHGSIHELPRQRANSLNQHMQVLIPRTPRVTEAQVTDARANINETLSEGSPRPSVVWALIMMRSVVMAAAAHARQEHQERREGQQVLATLRALRQRIAELEAQREAEQEEE